MSQSRRIGQFEVQELLGEGGIGQVFAARDTVLDRLVAIKSLRAELLNDRSFVERFRGEAKNLALLSHPNITTLYTLHEENGALYMIMELVRGRTLENILEERGTPFRVEEAVAIAAQAADGLAYAHEMGIVHRDIKPANLILTNSGLLKIMDFGIARAQGSQRMTRDGSIVGTLAYMSPEQCRGQEVDGRTDLYSLGIALYEMLTGKVPFSATTDYDLMQAHINAAPEPPSRTVAGIPPHVEKALLRALAKKPADRFATLTEFKSALGAPANRTEAVSIVHKVTRLATAGGMSAPLPAISAAVSTMTGSMKKSSIPFALKGVAIGGGLAFVLAGVLVYFLSPSRQSTTAATPPPVQPTKVSAPAQVAPPAPQSNPYIVDPRRLNNSVPPSPVIETRQGTPPAGGAPGKGGGKSPFEVAAEPESRGAAAASQPVAPADPNPPTPSRTAPDRVAPAPSTSERRDGESEPAATAAGASAASTSADTAVAAAAAAAADDARSAPARPAPDAGRVSEKDVLAAYEAKNFTSARELAEGCAKTGSPECQFVLGRLYETGSAGTKDLGMAADWYRKAAEQGLAKARYNLGAMYYAGEGVPKNPNLAAEWFSKAAYQNHALAQFNLAGLYASGEGVPRSVSEARRWYTEVIEKASDK